MKTFDFTLSDPIKIHKGGEETEASMLELFAPSTKNRKKVAKLKQGFMRSINSLTSENQVQEKTPDDDSELEPKAALALLQMGATEYDVYIDIFISLLTSGVCKVDGDVDLTSILVDKIYFADLERLMGEYLVNFILTSSGK